MNNTSYTHNPLEDRIGEDFLVPSQTGAILWQELKRRDLRYKFKPRTELGRFVVDFYCPELKLIIEIEKEDKADWEQREVWLVTHGYTIIQFSHAEVAREQKKVVDKIFFVCLHLASLV